MATKPEDPSEAPPTPEPKAARQDAGKTTKPRDDDFDIFIRNRTYPDAAAVFGTTAPSFSDMIKDCLVVLDTNALMVPFTVGKESLAQIKSTYQKLITAGRLVVPGQVAREFADVRARKLSDLYSTLQKKRTSLPHLHPGSYPLLDTVPGYSEAVKLEKEIDASIEKYGKALDGVLEQMRNWRWNDPVSTLYGSMFGAGVVVELSLKEDDLKRDLSRRQLHEIPPGYKDASKRDMGIGDLLIWHTILELGRSRQKNLIFISGDEKADWWHRSQSQPLYPRYELVDEYRRESGGKWFAITHLSHALELLKAGDRVVDEVRKEETRQEEIASPISLNADVMREVFVWLRRSYPLCAVSQPSEHMGMDFIVNTDSGSTGILLTRASATLREMRHEIRRSLPVRKSHKIDELHLIVLLDAEYESNVLMQHLEGLLTEEGLTSITIGFVSRHEFQARSNISKSTADRFLGMRRRS